MNRAVFLDRDGVINFAEVRNGIPHPPDDLRSMKIIPGVHKALKDLKNAGWLLLVVSNQPDVSRGITPKKRVLEINKFLATQLPIDKFYICYHDSGDRCQCRKPLPGLLITGGLEHQISMESSFMIGDRWRDIEAGENARCKTIFVDQNYKEPKPKRYDFKVRSLLEASQIILG